MYWGNAVTSKSLHIILNINYDVSTLCYTKQNDVSTFSNINSLILWNHESWSYSLNIFDILRNNTLQYDVSTLCYTKQNEVSTWLNYYVLRERDHIKKLTYHFEHQYFTIWCVNFVLYKAKWCVNLLKY